MPLTLTPLPGMPLVKEGDHLAALVLAGLERAAIQLQDGDVLVVAQKVVSKAEGRLVNLAAVNPSPRAQELAQIVEKDPRLVELILEEIYQLVMLIPGLLIVEHKLGFISANAGIDHSNVAGPGKDAEKWVLLLPKDPDASAMRLRRELENTTNARLGVLVIDSHGRAWRNGTVGVTIGLSGLPGLVDKRGDKDLYGYELRATIIGAADELAAGASLVMGQAAEGTPVVHARGFPYPLREADLGELIRPEEQDLFR